MKGSPRRAYGKRGLFSIRGREEVCLGRDSAFDRGSFFGKGHRNIVGFGSLSKFKSFQTYFMTMNFSPAGIYVHHVCLMDPQELVMDGCEPPWACWSLN